VELLDPEKEFLSGSAKAVKGLPEGYLLTNPLDLSDNLLTNPVKKIGVRRIGNVLGLATVSTATRLVFTGPISDHALNNTASICFIPAVPIRFRNFTGKRLPESDRHGKS
jgi:hypothetical protein